MAIDWSLNCAGNLRRSKQSVWSEFYMNSDIKSVDITLFVGSVSTLFVDLCLKFLFSSRNAGGHSNLCSSSQSTCVGRPRGQITFHYQTISFWLILDVLLFFAIWLDKDSTNIFTLYKPRCNEPLYIEDPEVPFYIVYFFPLNKFRQIRKLYNRWFISSIGLVFHNA